METTLTNLKTKTVITEQDYLKAKRIVQDYESKQLNIPAASNLLCGSFDPDTTTSSATKCKCGREKWEHPKTTLLCEFADYILHNANWSESFAGQPWYSEKLRKNVSSEELSGLFLNSR